MRVKYDIKDSAKEVKEQRKILPYTVSAIGGASELAAWKAEQAEKQAVWDAGKEERNAAGRERAWNVLQGGQSSANSLADKAYKAYNEDKPACAPQGNACQRPVDTAKPSVFQKILNYFLDIKFN